MRDLEAIDSELRLLLAIRRMVCEVEGRPSTARVLPTHPHLNKRNRLGPPSVWVAGRVLFASVFCTPKNVCAPLTTLLGRLGW